MGGRGAWSGTASRLRNYRNAVIERRRVSDYLLNPAKSKGKAEFLRLLGYNMKNQARLQADIRDGLRDSKARYTEANKYGRIHFQVNMKIGLNKKAEVVTGWFMDKGDTAPKLASLRPYRGKKDDF